MITRQADWGDDDPLRAVILDPPCLPGEAPLIDALQRIRGRPDCPVPPHQDVMNPESAAAGPLPLEPCEIAGCVLVLDEGRLRGILTIRDLVRLAAGHVDLSRTPLSAVMTTPVLSLKQGELTSSFAAIQLLRRHRIRHLPLVDVGDRPVGLLTLSSLRRQLSQAFFLRFRRVAEVMSARVITIEPEASLLEAVHRISEHAISCVVVVAGGGPPHRPLGIVTEHDLVQVRALGQDLEQLRVGQVMSAPPFSVAPGDDLGMVQELMNRRWLGHLVVTDAEGQLAGVVTETDLTNVLDPLDLYGIAEILRKQVQTLREDRNQLLAERRLDLRRGFQRDEFRLVYQPQLHLASGRVQGAEALLRWSSPEHGSVPPTEFIPLAEQTGLIHELGDWLLEAACRQALAWRSSEGGPISVAVNISGLQLEDPDFVRRTCATLERLGVDPSLIHLELTESVLVENFVHTAETIRQLQAAGLRIAIDDFGTGYASLSYLQHFSFDILKIDRSFIRELHRQSRNQAIVASIVRLADHLGFQLVAEGVETLSELGLLARMGCPVIQGLAVSPPLEVEAWPLFLAGRRAAEPQAVAGPPLGGGISRAGL